MRELKFRAWVEKPGTDLRYFRYFGLNTMLPNDISVVAYNQYTGLLDKNGREIYELMEINNRYVVEYLPPKYILKDISSGDIREIQEVINNENGIKVTREYTGI